MAYAHAITDHLRVILGDDLSNDIVSYLLSLKQVEDYDEFMSNVVDRDNKHHITAYEYIKGVLFRDNTKRATNKNRNRNKASNESYQEASRKPQETSNGQKTSHKGKKKFQDINTYKEKKKEKTGRQACDCEGQEHDFMNNCLNCGRIHCMEEGPGVCFFCGENVTLMGEENTLGRKSKQNVNMLRHKENKVFDDDNDYFKANLKNRNKDHKKDRVIALDFAARKVIESSEEDEKIRKKLLDDSLVHLKNVEKMFKNIQQSAEVRNIAKSQNDLVDLLIQMRHKRPVGKEEEIGEEDGGMAIIDYKVKVFDDESMANTDHGLCLSMHQPHASLLVAGVKRHEGRTWCTNHRGRLWIAAAARVPDEDEVAQLEEFYRAYHNDPDLMFPREYPTGCLLGCVFVVDCLDQETYRQQYPDGESDSPYVLICSDPIILPIFYPIAGKHKIYALDSDLHRIAKISLRYAQYIS